MRVVYIICVHGKGVICFSKLLLCAPTISDPASHRPLGTPKIRKCMCLGVAGSEVSPPINKTLSKGFRRKEIILQMVTFAHHPTTIYSCLVFVINLCLLEGKMLSENIKVPSTVSIFFFYDFYYKTFRSNSSFTSCRTHQRENGVSYVQFFIYFLFWIKQSYIWFMFFWSTLFTSITLLVRRLKVCCCCYCLHNNKWLTKTLNNKVFGVNICTYIPY